MEDPQVRAALAAVGLADEVTDFEVLAGGDTSTAWRVACRDGSAVVVKAFGKTDREAGAGAPVPEGLYQVEAEGLAALSALGGFPTPRVLAVTATALVLESLVPAPRGDVRFWEAAGRALAELHSVTGPRFGWHHDGWLGRLRQENTWHEDGHEFYATHRILRYLSEPLVQAALGPEDRAGLHRLCDRLPQLVPAAAPSLTHGDLAASNIIATSDGTPALIDPAASWMWPEVDLSMIYWIGRAWPQIQVPQRFFDAYAEQRSLDNGWRTRAPLLHLREILSLVAHGDERLDHVADIRAIIRTFR